MSMRRRDAVRGFAAASIVGALASCHRRWKLNAQDVNVRKTLPPLSFHLTDSATGRPATAADFRGKVVMVYFGYTNCPNVCPLTLYDSVKIFSSLGKKASDIRLLFVTVDPQRDTLPVLKKYVALYDSSNIVGLRGNASELESVASRYHAAYSVHPSPNPEKYAVTHTAAVYVFNKKGDPEFIIAGLASQQPDLSGITNDLRHLIDYDTI